MTGRIRPACLVGVWAALLAPVLLSGGGWAAGKAAAPARPKALPDPKVLDELAQDVTRFTEAVKGYRSAANGIIKRT